MADPWDQVCDEEADTYPYFLIYRNLGLRRSLRKAYRHYLAVYDGFTGSHSGLHVPGNWQDAAVKYFWKERATAWDIRNLHNYGARVAILHTQAVTTIAEKCVRLSRELSPGDKGWSDLMDSVDIVQGYLSPEVIRGITEKQNQPARAALPAATASDSVE